MEIFNLKDKQGYLKEVMELEYNEWASKPSENKNERINKKIDKYFNFIDDTYFCKLILIEENKLVGFISIFPHDCLEEPDLTPWYATMFVKKEYRGRGYSKILNDSILKEAKSRGIKKLYLKTYLDNYYEKFGAKYIKNINEREKLYMFYISID